MRKSFLYVLVCVAMLSPQWSRGIVLYTEGGSQMPNSYPGTDVGVVPSAGTYTVSGTLGTPSDGSDWFSFTVANGVQVTNIAYAVTGGNGFIGYWNTLYNGDNINGNTSGNMTGLPYPITASSGAFDVNLGANFSVGNTWTVTITAVAVGIPNPMLTATTTQSNATCNGVCNGSATVNAADGTPPYTYEWSPSGGNAATASNLCAGNYTVTVTDADFEQVVKSVTITQPDPLVASISGGGAVCPGSAASLTINVSGNGGSPVSGLLSDGTPFSGAGPAIDVFPTPLVSYSYAISSITSGGCTAAPGDLTGLAPVTIRQPGTWTGATSTDWGTGSNWCGGVPAYDADAYITDATAPNMPVLSDLRFANNVTVGAGCSLTITGTLDFDGDLVNNGGTLNTATGTLSLTGSLVAQTIPALDVNTIFFENPQGFHLTGDLVVRNSFYPMWGKIRADNHAVTMRQGWGFAGNGGDDSYLVLNGPDAKMVVEGNGTTYPSDPTVFAVGLSQHNPVLLKNNGVPDTFTVRVRDEVLTNGASGAPVNPTTTPAVNRTWDITENTPGGSNVTMTLQWNQGEENGPLFDYSNVYIAHYTGGGWQADPQYPNPGDPPSAMLAYLPGPGPWLATRTNITTFSPFTVASQGGSVPLLCQLSNIRATNDGPRNRVDWHTAAETSLDRYFVERSADAHTFRTMAEVPALDKSAGYTTYDEAPNAGLTYYRLKILGDDGTFTYSQIVSATMIGYGEVLLTALPNPAQDVLTVQLYGATDGRVRLTDVSGRMVAQATISNGAASFNTSALAAGTYILHFSNGATNRTLKVTRQ